MNTSYRSIYSHVLGTWVAVAENTRAHGKRAGCAVGLTAALALLAATPAGAQSTVYWDQNGIASGSGAVPTGTWSTSTGGWTESATGTTGTSALWVNNGSHAVFSAGADAVGNYTVTVDNVSAGAVFYRNAAPSSQLTLTGSTLTLAANTGIPQVDVASGTLRIDSGIAGTQGLQKTGTGTLVLSGTNNYTGGTTITGGTVDVSSTANIGGPTAGLAFDGGALRLNASNFASDGTVQLTGAGVIDVNATQDNWLGGRITGAGSLALVNTGAAVFDETLRITVGGKTNDYTGGTRIGIQGVLDARTNARVWNSASALGTGPVNIYFNSELKFYGSDSSASGLSITTHESSNHLGTNSGVYFEGGANAGNAHLTNQAQGSYVMFDTGTSAANARIDNFGGRVNFFNGSSGGNATITNGAVTGSPAIGGMVDLRDADMSGTTVVNNAGTVFISNATTGVAIGSLSGAGAVALGSKQLTVGGLGQSAAISGRISDAGSGYLDIFGGTYVIPAAAAGGSLVKVGAGTLTLSGSNDYTGTTTVNAGTLRVEGDQSAATGTTTVNSGGTLSSSGTGVVGGAVNVLGGGTLAGSGTVLGAVSIASGGHLAPGNSPGTLTLGSLALVPGSQMDFELGQAGVPGGPLNDLVNVTGNLTLAGTLNVATPSGGTFGPGLYRLFNYGGTLVNNGVSFGTVPGSAADLYLQTSVAQQVNLVNSTGVQLNFWDGSNLTSINNGQVDGGSGVMQLGAGLDRWTTASGAMNAPWLNGGFAIFQGTPGTVTVSNAGGAVEFSGAQFAVDGYTLAGAPITTNTPATIIRVGDGTAAGAGYTATVSAQVTGSGGLVKQDLGTLVLSGTNDYTGGTHLDEGTLLANNNQALGTGTLTIQGGTLGSQTHAVLANGVAVAGDFAVANAGATPGLTLAGNVALDVTAKVTQTTAGTVDFAGVISGGSNGLTLDATAAGARYIYSGSASNTYTGATTVQGNAVLELARTGGATAVAGDLNVAGQGAVLLNGSEQIANTATVTLNGSGQGGNDALQFAGAGLTETVGTLMGSGNVGLAGSKLVVGSGDFGGQIRDNGAVGGGIEKVGSGVLRLSGANSYSGATTVTGGTLQAGAANAFSANSAHSVASGAVLDTGGFSQTVASLSNSGTVSLLGSAPGSSLTVRGAYVGNNGLLRVGTALNATGPSDRLVIDGATASASGRTNVQVTNLGGLGALTTGAGIEVIAARNGATTTAQSTRDAFTLVGGHVDAGAYEYQLQAADQNGAGESWYLRSHSTAVPPTDPSVNPNQAPGVSPQETPRYRAEVPLFAAVPAQLRQADLAMLGNLHRRIGDDDARLPGVDFGERRAWARLIGADLDVRQEGTVSQASSGHLQGLQAGTDLFAMPSSNWRAGIYVGQMDGDADVSGLARDGWGAVGKTDLRSRYVGAYATYAAPTGFYADAVLQYGRHDYTLHPDGNSPVTGKGDGVQASIEVGQSFPLGGGWFIEPQLQLIHEQLNLDGVNLAGTQVNSDADSGWIGRAGVRIKGEMSTGIGRLQPYARVNLYRTSSGQDLVRFSTAAASTTVSSATGSTSAELAGGLTLTLNQSISVYGELGRLFDVGGDTRVKSSVEGSAGLRVRW
ncbi:autotransporter outer membrane beta-barrel domain-containing protein [Variovorax sp. OV329]|uniref:autotransporter outer membrane beta-barrel domain-containing protein n=1 Tax=Variovorax sp. OV329 TaxID=1882825 RepID=UPI0008E8EC98|nr:autotransporter outer membrane beta-barrel domain-containing protein [Variovorax sp. OV329]SFN24619.1 outer membrane autotransporter barrel domain-containing protein [Variovorax sp. OV329]